MHHTHALLLFEGSGAWNYFILPTACRLEGSGCPYIVTSSCVTSIDSIFFCCCITTKFVVDLSLLLLARLVFPDASDSVHGADVHSLQDCSGHFPLLVGSGLSSTFWTNLVVTHAVNMLHQESPLLLGWCSLSHRMFSGFVLVRRCGVPWPHSYRWVSLVAFDHAVVVFGRAMPILCWIWL